MPPKFFEGLSNEDMENIKAIAVRYCGTYPQELRSQFRLTHVIHDITAYHQNVAKLDLAMLATSPRINTVKTVVAGIVSHLRNNRL